MTDPTYILLAASATNNGIVRFFENVLSPLISPLGDGLKFFHALGLPWWSCIVVVTAIVRFLLFPLTIRQVRSMRAQQQLQPELKRIRERFKDDPQRQREEQMRLFQERGINPLSGCLPAVIQLPIFLSLYYVIREFGGYFGQPPQVPSFRTGGFLWFTDLSQADPYHILPIISALTMAAGMAITMRENQAPAQQRVLMLILPFVFMIFLWNFPAGLFMYWITTNLVTIVQNYAIYGHGIAGTGRPAGGEDRQQPERPMTQEEAAAHARKVAKRKRRKKKK
ncbi:YidC/Oxa1 family membrane protein insertase [Rubrobacter calidifluminis]|uniref:YidC/Oxa1 family membrane protein insertase n=1 Tax=Rubrobacter calidifluminis TaxID=1392640 RepID=UPI00235E81EE|nr:membrane protein insertase YidC [Rubrobacter calidifluminis]